MREHTFCALGSIYFLFCDIRLLMADGLKIHFDPSTICLSNIRTISVHELDSGEVLGMSLAKRETCIQKS